MSPDPPRPSARFSPSVAFCLLACLPLAPPPAPAQPVSPIGCSDGQREGFVGLAAYPNIAGCSGGWALPGVLDPSTTVPACGRSAGDDGANPAGAGCNVADLCAAGWHVCASPSDVATNSPTGCAGAVPAGESLFFATRQSSNGCAVCATGSNLGGCCDAATCCPGCLQTAVTANDVFGCGNLGAPLSNPACGVLDAFSNNACGALPAPWTCTGNNSFNEAHWVRKDGPASGGVLCCRDVPPTNQPPACSAGADIAQQCDGAAPAATASDPDGDPLSILWSASCSQAIFAPDPGQLLPVVTFGTHCGIECDLTLHVDDGKGGTCTDTVHVSIQDTLPPLLLDLGPRDGACLWPPNHRMVCFDRLADGIAATDNCPGPVPVSLTGCASSQPPDATGDGHTEPDCILTGPPGAPDGACVRSERQGGDPAGRTYGIGVAAADSCGNATPAELTILVPHDSREHPDCIRPQDG